jgi:hypothetical protein
MDKSRVRRLSKIADRIAPRQPELLGTIEDHYLRAWPPSDSDLLATVEQCTEHGPDCAVRKTRVMGRVRRIYLMDIDFVPEPEGYGWRHKSGSK